MFVFCYSRRRRHTGCALVTGVQTCARPIYVHLRDGAMLAHVAPYSARQFARAIVMPNLSPPVTTVAEGLAYRDRIAAAVPPELEFTPLIVAYLTDRTDPEELARGHAESGV